MQSYSYKCVIGALLCITASAFGQGGPCTTRTMADVYAVVDQALGLTTSMVTPTVVDVQAAINGVLSPCAQPALVPGNRMIGYCASPLDQYYNAPINALPVDAMNDAMVAALAGTRLGSEPEFNINLVTDQTPTIPSWQMNIGENNGESDSGNYPLTQQTLVGYRSE